MRKLNTGYSVLGRIRKIKTVTGIEIKGINIDLKIILRKTFTGNVIFSSCVTNVRRIIDKTIRKYKAVKNKRNIISKDIKAEPARRKTDIVYICIKSLNFLFSISFIPRRISSVCATGVTGSLRLTLKNIKITTSSEIRLRIYLGRGYFCFKSKYIPRITINKKDNKNTGSINLKIDKKPVNETK
jgi:hypothetical protein